MTCGKINLSCTKCRLCRQRTQVVPGAGSCSSKIVFIGEGPGKDEDLKGEPFVGRAGRILTESLRGAGVERSSVFITNLVKCRPPDNRRPRKDEIKTCRVYLDSEIEAVRPRLICALGQTVANSLLGNSQPMSAMMDKDWEVELGGRAYRLVVLYHPAACLYQRTKLKPFQESVKRAVAIAGKR